jgi:hypothetical protein
VKYILLLALISDNTFFSAKKRLLMAISDSENPISLQNSSFTIRPSIFRKRDTVIILARLNPLRLFFDKELTFLICLSNTLWGVKGKLSGFAS